MKQLELEKILQGLAKELEASQLLPACIELTIDQGVITKKVEHSDSTEINRQLVIDELRILYNIYGNGNANLEVHYSNTCAVGGNLKVLEARKIVDEAKDANENKILINYKGDVYEIMGYHPISSLQKVLQTYQKLNREVHQTVLTDIKNKFPTLDLEEQQTKTKPKSKKR